MMVVVAVVVAVAVAAVGVAMDRAGIPIKNTLGKGMLDIIVN